MYLLTYDKPHRKTQDLAFRLSCQDFVFTLAVIPWEERVNHKPLYNTKLSPIKEITPELMAANLCIDIVQFKEIPKGSNVAIGGAGILSKEFTRDNTVINSHCGWLPRVRGLDALKWAIYYNDHIGCTTHIIDEKTDKGLLIERKEVDLYPTDTLYSIAIRQYELELDMLVDCMINSTWLKAKEFSEPGNNPTRRMKHTTEMVTIERLKHRLLYHNLP